MRQDQSLCCRCTRASQVRLPSLKGMPCSCVQRVRSKPHSAPVCIACGCCALPAQFRLYMHILLTHSQTAVHAMLRLITNMRYAVVSRTAHPQVWPVQADDRGGRQRRGAHRGAARAGLPGQRRWGDLAAIHLQVRHSNAATMSLPCNPVPASLGNASVHLLHARCK